MRFEEEADAIIAGDGPNQCNALARAPGDDTRASTRAQGAPFCTTSRPWCRGLPSDLAAKHREWRRFCSEAPKSDDERGIREVKKKALGLVATSTPPRVGAAIR